MLDLDAIHYRKRNIKALQAHEAVWRDLTVQNWTLVPFNWVIARSFIVGVPHIQIWKPLPQGFGEDEISDVDAIWEETLLPAHLAQFA